jgi:hypothetical protein
MSSSAQNAIDKLKSYKSGSFDPMSGIKGNLLGMATGAMIGLALKKNVIVFAAIGALIGGAINMVLENRKENDQDGKE